MEGVLRGVDPVILYAVVGAVLAVVVGLIVVTGYLDSRGRKDGDSTEGDPDR